MDIFSLLSYINKISLLAFFVTTSVVGYQIYVLKKEKTKEQAPTIPDFKDKVKSNEVLNYTRLSGSLIKKDNKPANYSKLVFLIISLLTIMVVIFVLILIKQNSSSGNEASISPTIVVLPTPTLKPTCTSQACLTPTQAPTVGPTVALSLSPAVSSSATLIVSLSPSPTEIVLAQAAPTCTGQACLTPTKTSPTQGITNSKLRTLPETGTIGKGLLIIGVAISAIFFSFWF
ncbi:hypothetical protein HZA75_05380 [Candidatus Roizmanbacteria bacterium]|nr:hypothetical protein [Candidatus Roizmanbacteria bacterium]